jgi:hypothetical protein
MAALDDRDSTSVVVRDTGDLPACFRESVSGSGRNHARIDVIKLLAVQDVGRADFRALECRERHVVSSDRAAVHDPDIGMNDLLEGGRSRCSMGPDNGSDGDRQAHGGNSGEN